MGYVAALALSLCPGAKADSSAPHRRARQVRRYLYALHTYICICNVVTDC